MMNENLKIAVRAAIEAGRAIMKIYSSNIEFGLKPDLSPITEADKDANDVINFYLNQTGIPVISEENKEVNYGERKKWNECWIVDPLDGTKEFIKRNGEFTVNIALVKEGRPILGVIYVPEKKELYFGDVEKQQAFKMMVNDGKYEAGNLTGASTIIPKGEKGSIRVVASRSHLNEETETFVNNLKSKNPEKKIEVVSKGSSLKFCLIAEGKADIYPRYSPTMEWDTAAGHAICNAVNIKVISGDTKKELKYNKESLLNSHFLAKN